LSDLVRASKRGLLSNSASIGMTRGVAIVVGFVNSIVVARALSLDARGTFFLLVATAQIAIQFGNLGLPSANTYLISNRPIIGGRLLANTMWIALVACLVLGVVGFTIGSLVPSYDWMLGAEGLGVLLYAAAGLAMLLLQNFLIGQLRIGSSNVVELVAKVGSVALLILVWAAGFAGVLSFLACTIIGTVLAALYALKSLQIKVTLQSWDAPLFREQFAVGARAYLACTLALWTLMPAFVIESRLGSGDLALFAQAQLICVMALVVPGAVGTALFPRLGLLSKSSDRIAFTMYSMAVCGIAMILVIACIAATAPWIIPWVYGMPYEPSVGLLMAMLPGIFGLGLSSVTQNSLIANGYPWSCSAAPLVAAVVMAAGLWWFRSLEAAAWLYSGAGIVQFLISLAAWYRLRHQTDAVRRGGDRVEKESASE